MAWCYVVGNEHAVSMRLIGHRTRSDGHDQSDMVNGLKQCAVHRVSTASN